MNHTIIKKALNEALTQKYYDELMGCDDEEHIFGTGFTADMKRLIRKTDDKLLYYSKYVAIAACACIAIGCAVLLPNLMNSGIRIEPPVTTPVVESAPDTGTTTSDTTLPIIITTPEDTTTAEITTAPEETTLDTDSAVTTEITTEITTAPITTTDEKATDDDNPPTPAVPDDEDEFADANGDIIDTPDSDGDVIVEEEYDSDSAPPISEEGDAETDADVDVEIEDDVDEDVSTDSDDDIVFEDGDDVVIEEEEDEVEIEDDVEIEEDDVNPGAGGDIPPFPRGNTLREIYETYTSGKLEDTRVCSVYYRNVGCADEFINGCIFDLGFVEEYIISQADAVRLDKSAQENTGDTAEYPADYDVPVAGDDTTAFETSLERSILVQLGEGELVNNVYFYDSSRRKNYGEFFRGEISDDEDVMDDEDPFTLYVGIEIFESGMAYYGNSVPMQFDPTATAELFKRFDKRGIPRWPSTVEDIMSYTEITEESIIGGVAKISNVYDIGLSGVEINTNEEIAGLYNIINSLKKSPCLHGYTKGQIEIEFYVSNTLTTVKLIISDPFVDKPVMYITDGDGGGTSIEITRKKAQEIIAYICKCAGVAEPFFYVTAEEYLDYVGVDFDGVKEISGRGEINGEGCTFSITAPEKIKKLTEMVSAELKNTKYVGSGNSKSWLYFDFRMDNWTLSLCEGFVRVGPYAASCFEINGDLLGKINEYMAKNADETVMEDVDIEDD